MVLIFSWREYWCPVLSDMQSQRLDFKKKIFKHTVCYLIYLHTQINTSVAYRQTLLLALKMCSGTL